MSYDSDKTLLRLYMHKWILGYGTLYEIFLVTSSFISYDSVDTLHNMSYDKGVVYTESPYNFIF